MKNRKTILTVFAVLALLCLGIGYAALSSTLNLGGNISASGTDDSTPTGDATTEYLYLKWADDTLPSGDSLPIDYSVSEGSTGHIGLSPIYSDSHQQGDLIGLYLSVEGLSKKGESASAQAVFLIELGVEGSADAVATYTLTDQNGNAIAPYVMSIDVTMTKLEDAEGNKYTDPASDEIEGLKDHDYVLLTITVTNQRTLIYAEDSYDYNLEVYVTATATNE